MSDDKIASIIARINAEYGGKTGDMANRGDEEPPVGRIPTGSLELDYATGGGIPIGRWSRFYGPKSSGKSTKCWHIIANAQKMGLTCAYYNVEKQFTDEFAAKQGVDTNKLIVVQTAVTETVGEILEGTLDEVDVHVIDSCSQSVTRTQLADGLNEREYMGIHARKWQAQFEFINERFDRNRNVIILVDQVRKKGLGTNFVSDGPPGGSMMEHVSSMTVEFKSGKHLWYDKDGILDDTRNTKQKTFSGGIEADGMEVQAQVVKARVCRPFRTARMKWDFNKAEFDHADELVKAAKYFGVGEHTQGWVKMPGEDKAIRPREFRDRILNDPALAEQIRAKVLGYDLAEAV